MTESWQDSFRKIAPKTDLPEGTPKVFRAAGATVVLLRRGDTVEAIDGSCAAEDADTPHAVLVARILDCVAVGLGERSAEWQSLVEKGGLAARLEDGWAWVCLDGCRTS